jgi:hypothetical protein
MSHDHADASLDELARRAAEGDREALSALVRDLQHPMYRLALRFLGIPTTPRTPARRSWFAS